jgi:prevent-host-death family protein
VCSPRTRGWSQGEQGQAEDGAVLPAHAGMVLGRKLLSSPVRKAKNHARLASVQGMVENMNADTGHTHELSVPEARDHFSECVNRAVYGGEVTFVTRGRRHQRAAAIVPADMVDHYEELLDERDAHIAAERLADIEAGRSTVVPFDEVMRQLGLTEDELGR